MSGNKKYREHEKDPALRALHSMAEGMREKDSVITFIEEVLTESERLVLGRRILIAQMLVTGHSQASVREKLHVSPNTFTRTRKWLEELIPNHQETLKDFEKSKPGKKTGAFGYTNPLSFGGLKKKPSTHFLLFNIADELFKRDE